MRPKAALCARVGNIVSLKDNGGSQDVPRKPAVLFVCLGNICRSPLAEAAFRAEVVRMGLDVEVDSAGTGGWHVGKPPDRRAQAVARRYGIDISLHRARQVTRALSYVVRLMPPQFVKPSVKSQKNDAADASAIAEAVQRPTIRFVPIKSADQQAVLMLHRAPGKAR